MADTIKAAWLRLPGQRWRLVAVGPEAVVRDLLRSEAAQHPRRDTLVTVPGVDPNDRPTRRRTG